MGGFLLMTVISLAVAFAVKTWSKNRVRGTVRAVAAALQFTPGGFADHSDEWNIHECFDGLVDGMQSAIAVADRIEEVAEKKVRIFGVLIKVKAPASPNFHYEIRAAGMGAKKNFSHPDAQFNKICAVNCDNGPSFLTLMDSLGLRALVLAYLQSSHVAEINEYSAWCEIPHAHFMAKEELMGAVKRTARLIKALHERAAKQGLLAQQKAA